MTDSHEHVLLRTGLIEGLRASRATEIEIFDAFEPSVRDVPHAEGEWSPKDHLAHLSAWRQHMADVLAARREGREFPRDPRTIDEINAVLVAERAEWDWERVNAEAESTAAALVAEVLAADGEVLREEKTIGPILGDGPEHDLAHLGELAARVGLESNVLALADTSLAIIDRGGWPARSAAFARYNLACFHALAGNLDVARSLLRQALPEDEELRTVAATDDELVALRDEIPTLAQGADLPPVL
jgi:hypothetical protein